MRKWRERRGRGLLIKGDGREETGDGK